MPGESYDPKQLQDLRAAAKELHDFSLVVERAIETAVESGDVRSATAASAELQLKTAEYKKLRATLSPEVLFLAKYNVVVEGAHEVSFVLPKGESVIEMLKEAQLLEGDIELINPDQLTTWQADPRFATAGTTPQRIHIDGHVEGGDAKSRAEQEAFLKAQGLEIPSIEDVAAAFVAYYIATKKPLFGFYKDTDVTYMVRVASGTLRFDSDGLTGGNDGNRDDDGVAVAAHVPCPRSR